jgi:hypothetical protein
MYSISHYLALFAWYNVVIFSQPTAGGSGTRLLPNPNPAKTADLWSFNSSSSPCSHFRRCKRSSRILHRGNMLEQLLGTDGPRLGIYTGPGRF